MLKRRAAKAKDVKNDAHADKHDAEKKDADKHEAAKPADAHAENAEHAHAASDADKKAPADAHDAKPAEQNDHAAPAPAHADAAFTGEQALQMLREGNARWVSGKVQSPNADSAAREEAAKGQKPFVSVLGCADSRVPLERLFDRGVGEVFAVRVAGNVAGDSETGTLEYGIGHLNTPLLVVMGHSKCDVVSAAASGAQVRGKVVNLLAHVQPAVDRAKAQNPNASQDELVAAAVKENVWQSISDLFRESSTVRDAAESGKLLVVGAVYDIATGEVSFLGSHPWQKEVIAAGKHFASSTQTAAHTPAASDAHAPVQQEAKHDAGHDSAHEVSKDAPTVVASETVEQSQSDEHAEHADHAPKDHE
jgi:carbonic anhydrase